LSRPSDVSRLVALDATTSVNSIVISAIFREGN
jgi:hypothetical protein